MTGTRKPPPPLKKDTENRYQFYRFPVEYAFRMTNGKPEYRFDLILDTQTNQVTAPVYSIGQMAMVNDRTPSKWLNRLCPDSAIRIQIKVPSTVATGGWYIFQCYYPEQIAIFLKRYNHPWTQDENPAQKVNEELLKFLKANETIARYPAAVTQPQVEVIEPKQIEMETVVIERSRNVVIPKNVNEIWQSVLENLYPLTTKSFLSKFGQLLSFDGSIAVIGLPTQATFNIAKGKISHIEAAFRLTTDSPVKAVVQVFSQNTHSTLPSTVPSTVPVKPIVEQDAKQLDLLEGLESSEEGSQVEELTTMFYHNHRIEQRKTDGYVNATQMCQANGKRVSDWMRTQDYERYLAAISSVTGIPAAKLVIVSTQGTWIHPELAVKLGRWISVEFEIWCDEHIKTLMITGSTSLDTKSHPTPAEVLLQTAQTLVDYEKRLLKLERSYVQDKAEREASRKALLALPTSDKKAPEFTPRMKVIALIQSRAGYEEAEYKVCWRRLYQQYELTCHCNLKARMKHSGCKTKLDQIEYDGGMEILFAIATELFAIKEVD